MRKDTKQMINLLKSEGAVTDYEADTAGILNPRREYAIISQRTDLDVDKHNQTEQKREYKLLN